MKGIAWQDLAVWRRLLPGVFTVFLCLPAHAAAGDGSRNSEISGPLAARVIGIADGDTLIVRAVIWPGQEVETLVRLDGIDAPEMTAECRAARDLAIAARRRLRRLAGDWVLLYRIRFGKYAGRVLAEVHDRKARPIGPRLIAAGLARPYAGGRRTTWCAR